MKKKVLKFKAKHHQKLVKATTNINKTSGFRV